MRKETRLQMLLFDRHRFHYCFFEIMLAELPTIIIHFKA